MPFDTPLEPHEEVPFQVWKSKVAPGDSGEDYDFRGAYKSGITPDPQSGHWPDTFKKPNHPTFSDQSIYSSLSGTKPGTWQGEKYTPFGGDQESFGYQQHPFWKALEGVVNGIRGGVSKAPWGMHEPTVTAGAGVEKGLSATGDVLADPRNAWMGVGPLGMAAKFGRIPHFGKDSGGFNLPTSAMRGSLNIPRPNRRLNEIPGGTEQAVRSDYLGNVRGLNAMADITIQGPGGDNGKAYDAANRVYSDLSKSDQHAFLKTLQGRKALEQELIRRNVPTGWLGFGN